jgi:hypothetical protein
VIATIKEAQEKLGELEGQMAVMIRAFERRTGLQVAEVQLRRVMGFEQKDRAIQSVRLKAEVV